MKIKTPRPETHKALFAKKVDLRLHEKIDAMYEKFDVSKWVIVEAIIAEGLKIKVDNPLNIKQILKDL